jgi:HlyD family secretion protein
MRKLVGSVAVVLLGAGAVYGMGSSVGWPPWREAAAATRYMTAPVERGDVVQTVSTTGTLNAFVTVEVGTQLSGQVARLFVDFNTNVKAGQALAQLDRKSFEARLAESKASTAVAEAAVKIQRSRLERARIDLRNAEAQRAVLMARLDNARAQSEVTANTFERSTSLQKMGNTSKSQTELARAARDSAAAEMREAEEIVAAHELVVAGAAVDLERSQAELDSALETVRQREAIEHSMEIDLERTTIRSPIDGTVVGRNVSEGQTVAASLEAPVLFTIAGDLQRMDIYARVDESDIGKIRVGQAAQFSVDAYPDRRFSAMVRDIRKAPQVTQNVVTYTVVLGTTNPGALLLPGMTATVHVVTSQARDVLRIPMTALRFAPSVADGSKELSPGNGNNGVQTTVWTLDGTRIAVPVSVVLGDDDGSYAALVVGDLKEGDQIVVGEAEEAARDRLFGFRLGF